LPLSGQEDKISGFGRSLAMNEKIETFDEVSIFLFAILACARPGMLAVVSNP